MSLTLSEALRQVELEVGRTDHCRVQGSRIEMRVVEEPAVPSRLDGSDVMLDASVDFPTPTVGIVVRATMGTLPLPDCPEIPEARSHRDLRSRGSRRSNRSR
jgi:hypothetical protein